MVACWYKTAIDRVAGRRKPTRLHFLFKPCYSFSMREKQCIVFIGPPGAGKDTQSELLADDFGFNHFRTSRIIEEKIKNAEPNDPVLRQAKADYDSGKLVNYELTASWVIEKIREIAASSQSIVFSGSFRRVSEVKLELPICEELYGRENIHFVYIPISEETSVYRNSHRRICEANQHPFPDIPKYRDLKACPEDGSPIIIRSIDNPKIIPIRYQTYLQETKPVLEYLESVGFSVVIIDGEQPIRKVHEEVLKRIDESFHEEVIGD